MPCVRIEDLPDTEKIIDVKKHQPITVAGPSKAVVFKLFFVRVPPDVISLQHCNPKVLVFVRVPPDVIFL
jgi:hypothetical protein